MISKIFAKLKDPEYRKAFVASQISIAIPFQIRGLLKSRGWRQEDLAARAGMRQPRISALLSPGEARPNIETLRRIAEAFDCGLQVRFVSFSELVNQSETFEPDNFSIPTFDEDVRHYEELENGAVVAQEPAIVTRIHYVDTEARAPSIVPHRYDMTAERSKLWGVGDNVVSPLELTLPGVATDPNFTDAECA